MQLSFLDWLVLAAYFAVTLAIGFFYYRRASGSVGEFFISGRKVPWWLAGTSMVATTFSADTPLVVTGIVYRYGIAGNWLWWSMALSGMATVFFFARLWRRAGVLTDMELAELRYAGRPAAFLRGFRALYLALPVNTIIMGWVTLAMAKILELTLGVQKLHAVMFCLGLTLAYTAIAGLWAVLWTDLLQFVLMMGAVITLAAFAVHAVGGVDALVARLSAQHPASLAFVPDWTSGWFVAFLVYLSVNWWASWYPGAEPGGGGYIAQRIFSAKNEKHSLVATLWFNLAHYALRPWPWILTALVAVLLFPQPKDPEAAYIQVMLAHLPASLRGLMLAGFAAAYMSTIATHINLGGSYLINDFYRRFLRPGRDERHYVLASRGASVLVALLAAVATYFMSSIEGAWKFLIAIGAGAGLVFMLRWFWWRINAWSEISAMSAAAVSSLFLQSRAATMLAWRLGELDPQLPAGPLDPSHPHGFAWLMVLTTAFTTFVWILVTFLTVPEPREKLQAFYDRVHPAGPGWKPFAERVAQPPSAVLESSCSDGGGRDSSRAVAAAKKEGALAPEGKQSLLWSFFDWLAGCALIYCSLFGLGHLVFGRHLPGAALLAAAALCFAFIFWDLSRRGWESLT